MTEQSKNETLGTCDRVKGHIRPHPLRASCWNWRVTDEETERCELTEGCIGDKDHLPEECVVWRVTDEETEMNIYSDDDLATWCRVMQVGPACSRPCGNCRTNSVTFGQLRRRMKRVTDEETEPNLSRIPISDEGLEQARMEMKLLGPSHHMVFARPFVNRIDKAERDRDEFQRQRNEALNRVDKLESALREIRGDHPDVTARALLMTSGQAAINAPEGETMTLYASRAERHPNTPETTPERIVVRTTYGPIVNEVTEDIGHVKSFHAQLGALIEQLESPS